VSGVWSLREQKKLAGELTEDVVVGVDDDELRNVGAVGIGRIGTGFGRDTVARILPRLKALETENPQLRPAVSDVRWINSSGRACLV